MNALYTYLQDHLAGATFGLNLLKDLGEQQLDQELANLAKSVLGEVEAGRQTLERVLKCLGANASPLKDASAWVAQKLGSTKLSTNKPFGLFEAVELMTLGVLGKVALWKSLEVLPPLLNST